jgi:hypothetical protein
MFSNYLKYFNKFWFDDIKFLKDILYNLYILTISIKLIKYKFKLYIYMYNNTLTLMNIYH